MSDQAVKAMEAALRQLESLKGCIRDGGLWNCQWCAVTVERTREILTDAILAERKEPS
jgi:hypothetical protein